MISTLLATICVLHAIQSNAASNNWGGLPDNTHGAVMHTQGNLGVAFEADATPWVEQVGLRPRSFVFHNFLTDSERAHIIRLAAPQMKRSSVVGKHGEGVVDDIRTSYGMFLRRFQDPVIERIERRISLWTHLPIENQEDIQVLRYQAGQKYGAHYDSAAGTSEAGPHFRVATLLMYLSDVEEGGETAFPNDSVWADPILPARVGPVSECAKGHVAAKPKAGDAVLFYSYHPNMTMDTASMHTGCPIIKGIKWAAPIWIHDIPFPGSPLRAPLASELPHNPGLCEDHHSMCAKWAAEGECTANAEFMVGSEGGGGSCRKACKVCEHCLLNEWECINRNRLRGGYLALDREELKWLGVGDDFFGVEQSPDL